LWEADIVDLRTIQNYNYNYGYLLIVIDVLSIFTWVEKLRDKTTASLATTLVHILSRSKRPIVLQTDRGKEFIGAATQLFLKNASIGFRIARNPDMKVAVVERFNRTLKERIEIFYLYKK